MRVFIYYKITQIFIMHIPLRMYISLKLHWIFNVLRIFKVLRHIIKKKNRNINNKMLYSSNKNKANSPI